MSIVRQDAWTNDEDLVLAEVVLRHIREGSTQLSAFEEVGERLSRTAAACGFRWNSSVRKKYEAAIAIAKKQRKSLKKTKLDDENRSEELEVAEEVGMIKPEQVNEIETEVAPKLSIDDIIQFLVTNKALLSSNTDMVGENDQLKEKLLVVTDEHEKLLKAYNELQEDYQVMKQDYKLLIDIMDRAKQLSVTKK